MRTSISLTTFPDPLADHLREVVEDADETGIDTVWIADHLLQADRPRPRTRRCPGR